MLRFTRQTPAHVAAAVFIHSVFWSAAVHSLDAIQLSEVAESPQRSAPAVAISLNQPTLKSQLSATIKSIPVQVGDRVKRGELLVSLDCSDYNIDQQIAAASLEAAKARMELAQSQLNRAKSLLAQKLTSREDFDAKQSSFAALNAEYKLQRASQRRAAINVSRCQITAPFNGVVIERRAAVGQLATMGSELVTLIDNQNIELSVQVSAEDAANLASASSFESAFTFKNGHDYPVTLRQLSEAINPATRNREARFVFSGKRPLPGSAGKLLWRDSRAFIPARFIVTQSGQLGVNILVDGKAEFVPLADARPGRAVATDLPPDTLLLPRGFANN